MSSRFRLRASLREKRRRLLRIPETLAEYARRSEMVPYSHVLAGGLPDDGETYGILDSLDTADREWTVMDYLCARPGCDCQEVRLSFHGSDPEDEDTDERFGVRVPLGKGPPRFQDLVGMSLAEAKAVFAEWEANTRHDSRALRARYDDARRRVPEVRAPVRAAPQVGHLVAPMGRRDPCPCGSGKRHKNCCGRDVR